MKTKNDKAELIAAAQLTADVPEFWQEVSQKLEEDQQSKRELVKPRGHVKSSQNE